MNLRACILALLYCVTLQISNVTGQEPAKPCLLYCGDKRSFSETPERQRDQNGVLLARATPGKGRVVVMTNAGSIANFAMPSRIRNLKRLQSALATVGFAFALGRFPVHV
jgi:hypothetical protein